MGRKIEYIGAVVEVTDYEDKHRYRNQLGFVDGIPLNPILRSDFDSTPNDDREPLEIADWWNKPFIRSCSWADWDESWDTYRERMAQFDGTAKDTEAEFNARKEAQKANWFNSWPSGTRYEVRCLNGGAWDRSSGVAMVGTLEEAVSIAKSYVPVDYGMF